MEKVRHALKTKEEAEERTPGSLASVGAEFQVRYQRAFTQRQHVVSNRAFAARTKLEENAGRTEPPHLLEAARRADGEHGCECPCIENTHMRETSSGDTAALEKGDGALDADLVVTLQQVTLSEESTVPPRDTAGNPLLKQQMKPHYLEVLERSDKTTTKPRYRPNQ